MQEGVGGSRRLSQQSPERSVGKEPGWSLGVGSLELESREVGGKTFFWVICSQKHRTNGASWDPVSD